MNLHPQIEALLGTDIATAGTRPPTVEEMRVGYGAGASALGGPAEPVAQIVSIEIPREDGGTLPARLYSPEGCDERTGAIVWFHGGGWVAGDLDGVDTLCRALANASGAHLVSVDYRLAPEHPFPAAVHDASTAVAWALGGAGVALRHDPSRVVVGGDSSGGNLAAVAALQARSGGLPPLRAQMLAYPATDATRTESSYREYDGPGLSGESMRHWWSIYLAGTDGRHPDASPVHAADLLGVAPALVMVAQFDPLFDEGVAYAKALQTDGVECELSVYPDMIHGFLRMAGAVDRAHQGIAELGAFARRHLTGADGDAVNRA